jgi:myosin heavy subunit
MLCCVMLRHAVTCCVLQDIDGVDDAREYAEVMQALSDIGVTSGEISTLLRTLSGILWLGNLKIEAVHANDSSKIKGDAALANAAQLLSLSEEDLVHALTHKKVRLVCGGRGGGAVGGKNVSW